MLDRRGLGAVATGAERERENVSVPMANAELFRLAGDRRRTLELASGWSLEAVDIVLGVFRV